MINTKDLEEISQAVVVAELLKRGVSISIPFGDIQRYDLIMDCNGELYRLQVKTGNFKGDYIEFSVASSAYHRGGKRESYKGQVEFFIVYCPHNNEVYLVPIHDVPNTTACLRISAPRNGQLKGVRWASDYTLDKQMLKI